ncbi:MAG: S4 domain-containing protein [Pseudomonadota bacterium]|nr:S4 domain-containing protein [Pseudomonadota bacterium]
MAKGSKECTEVRLDRWLWASRFFKTRQLAVGAIKGGHVALNGHRAKPSKVVHEGDSLQIQRGREEFLITVAGLSEKRLSATLAAELYAESAESCAQRELLHEQLRAEARAVRYDRGRPSKRDRRVLEKFKREADR